MNCTRYSVKEGNSTGSSSSWIAGGCYKDLINTSVVFFSVSFLTVPQNTARSIHFVVEFERRSSLDASHLITLFLQNVRFVTLFTVIWWWHFAAIADLQKRQNAVFRRKRGNYSVRNVFHSAARSCFTSISLLKSPFWLNESSLIFLSGTLINLTTSRVNKHVSQCQPVTLPCYL